MMYQKSLMKLTQEGESYFHWRGEHVSRLESLFDATLALAMTFVVVSLEVPASFDELLRALRQFPVFVVCCAFLIGLWYVNFKFHRRYGLEDFPTVVFNSILILLVLFFVYPMRFMATVLFSGANIRWVESQQLMYMYAGGFAAFGIVYSAMYFYAWTKRDALELNENERTVTRFALSAQLINVAVGLIAVVISGISAQWTPIAGLCFFAIGPGQFINGYLSGRRIRSESDVEKGTN